MMNNKQDEIHYNKKDIEGPITFNFENYYTPENNPYCDGYSVDIYAFRGGVLIDKDEMAMFNEQEPEEFRKSLYNYIKRRTEEKDQTEEWKTDLIKKIEALS